MSDSPVVFPERTVLRRKPMRQWFAIELSAYVFICLALVSAAWTNGHVSGVAVFATWLVAGGVVAAAVREIYRGRTRRRQENRMRAAPP